MNIIDTEALAEIERLSEVIDEKIDDIGKLVMEQIRLRAALKKAQRGRSFAPDAERNEIVLIFEEADFEPIQKFMDEQP